MLKAHETVIGLQELKRSLFGPNPKESMSRVRITKGVLRLMKYVGQESNPGQLLGRQLCLPIYHQCM